MAHFAQLNGDNVVIRVIVVNNAELLDNGVESEAKGIAFCESLLSGRWKQTSYNGSFRKRFAGIGYTFDEAADAFIPPQPFPSWSLDGNLDWVAPVAYPTDGKRYAWDEEAREWHRVNDCPHSISARQIRLYLLSKDVALSAVDAAIAQIPDEKQREIAKVEWAYAPWIERTHPLLIPIASALGMSEADVDQAFRDAATL